MNVQFLKSHPEFAYFKGDNANLPEDQVEKLLKSGFVMVIPTEQDDIDEANTLPEGLPFRDLLFKNGFKTIEEVIGCKENLVEIKGIGQKSFAEIKEFLEKESE